LYSVLTAAEVQGGIRITLLLHNTTHTNERQTQNFMAMSQLR